MAVTSTVLDVTVLLLCVSASVVALGATDAGGPGGPTPTDAADRLVTETATVAYPDGDAPNGTRRVTATRAELLALLAVRDAEGAFDREAVASVRAGIGPRTRVDATVRRDDAASRSGAAGGIPGSDARRRSGAPPARGEAASSPHSIVGAAVPTRGVSGRGRAHGVDDAGGSVAVGPEPPRTADVAVAVVRQPVPDGFSDASGERRPSKGVVRIVVRRW
ncbi:hypothetical protein EXE44_13330 [Halorubrum sp. SS7]|uniref:DUF7284 family protein n=1 Tax=Halorubrum sp. SS7 TaxID=2518119 RepID=UPI0010F92754|nr:hypothetical protein [Halorubrum sp. SS7]TKX56738.1 hypothetical protein EXE44_13330 [Halorubrum sp. SS7]